MKLGFKTWLIELGQGFSTLATHENQLPTMWVNHLGQSTRSSLQMTLPSERQGLAECLLGAQAPQPAGKDFGYLELVAVLFHLPPPILPSATAGKQSLPRAVTLSSRVFWTCWQEVNYNATHFSPYKCYLLTLFDMLVGINLNFTA